MARKTKQQQKTRTTKEELIQVDVYLLPAPIAHMYQVLRETIAEEIIALLSPVYAEVVRVQDDEDNGEAVACYDTNRKEVWRYYLSPTNVSNAQKAREKDQMMKYLASEGISIVEEGENDTTD